MSTPVGPRAPGRLREGSDLRAAAAHDVLGDGVDLVLHLHLLEPIVRHSHPKHAKVGPSKVQSQELSILCRQEGPLLVHRDQDLNPTSPAINGVLYTHGALKTHEIINTGHL